MDAHTSLQLFSISRLVACSLAFACCAWCFITSLGCAVPRWTPRILAIRSLRPRKELEYSLTLRTLDTNAANPVAINRYQYVRLLPARVVSVISTNCVYHLLISLPRVCAWLLKIKITCTGCGSGRQTGQKTEITPAIYFD